MLKNYYSANILNYCMYFSLMATFPVNVNLGHLVAPDCSVVPVENVELEISGWMCLLSVSEQ